MCNLYRQRSGPQTIMDLAQALRSNVGNLEPRDIYPDYAAPIVRTGADGVRELVEARWGMPSPRNILMEKTGKRADKLRAKGRIIDPAEFASMLELEPDTGITNVRRTDSRHWQPDLTPANRCLVPFTAFSEPGRDGDGKYQPIWFKLNVDDPDPLAFFAGIHRLDWTGVRRAKTGRETIDLMAFLTTEPSEPVKSVHPKAMPVILTEPDDIETWMTAPWEIAKELQRALPDDALVVI
ncbi:SOS response-associated peptidase [Brevundimonas sp. UBA4553]|nr:SOS response-associated peptidase family protein [Brevundimonas sp. UBA4553]